MTVKMSSEGDSSKNVSSETTEKNDSEKAESTAEVKEPEPEKSSENKVEKKDEDAKPKEEPKDSSSEPDKKIENDKEPAENNDTKKEENDIKTVEKKEEKNDTKTEDEDENTEKDEDSEKGEEEDEEEDKETPLLDQPLEKSGKRERKNVQRFNEEFSSDSKDGVKVDIPSGSGTALGNIPRIDASISRFKNDDMKLLHRVLFKTIGKSTMIKRNIKKFNGFEFKRDSDEYKKKVAVLQKSDLKQLKSICEMLDLLKTGHKDDIIERILDFLLEPKDSGKAVGGGRPKRTAAVRANNRGYSSHDNYSSDERHSSRSGRDKGRRANLKDESSSAASDEDFEPSDEGSDEKPPVKRKRGERKKVESDDEDASEMDSPSSEEDSDFQDEPKSKKKKTVKTNNKAKGKGAKRGRKPAAKRGPKPGKKRNKESSEEEEEEEEESDHKDEGSSSSEDEPLAKKAKSAQPPTDDDIKNYVKEILEGANLEEITMKTVCQQVYAHYPDFDLTHKKDFIKTTVKSLIST